MSIGWGQDTTPPELIDISFSPTEVDISNQDQQVTVNYTVSDDLSGFERILIWFSPEYNMDIGIGQNCHDGSGDTYVEGTCTITIPQYTEGGIYYLVVSIVEDQLNNSNSSYNTEQLETKTIFERIERMEQNTNTS